MSAFWRARTAVVSAAKGWSCVWLLVLVPWGANSLRFGARLTDLLSVMLIWMVATGIVTLATTVILVVPYLCLRSADTLLHKPWLLFVESGVIAVLASLVLTGFLKPHAETYLRSLRPWLMFALATSLTSSAFYMRRIKAIGTANG